MSQSCISLSPALLRTRAPELLREAQLELAYRRLRHFARFTWPCIEGGRPFIGGWHIDCICDHLEAVWRGQIFRLIINIPPRCMKSTLVDVDFPAWVWLRAPHRQFLSSSYAQSLTIRDNVRCRRILQHPRYDHLLSLAMEQNPTTWDRGKLELQGDQNAKERYDNNYGGYRLASSVEGALTGEGGDIIIIDDPNNVVEAESDTIRNATNTWFDEAMQTRLNSPHDGAINIIQQRTQQERLT